MKRLSLIAPLLVALTLSACGSDTSTNTTGTQASASPGTGPRGFMNEEVRSCLEKQGVELPEPPQGGDGQPPQGADGPPAQGGEPPAGGFPGTPPAGGPGGMSDEDREKMQEALKACGVEMPEGGPGGGGPRPDANDADYQARVQDYVACVRENGFDLPDPDFSGDGPIFDPEEVDQSDETFQEASATCRDKLRPQNESEGTATTS